MDDDRLSTGLAGIIGVTVTFAVVGGALLLLRRVQGRRATGAGTAGTAGTASPEPG